VLEVSDLTVRHGLVEAVRGVSLTVGAGEMVALVGANGSGKSSLLEAVSGIVRPVGGAVTFLGERIDALPAHAVIARGIAHVPEDRLIFTRLTVGENLLVGAAAGFGMAEAASRRRQVLSRFPELRDRLDERASALSGGQRQLLAVARGLMADPQLLLLDEPTLGLAPIATERIFTLLSELRDAGLGLLVVDQNVDRALDAADRAYVLDKGRIALSGPASVLSKDASLADAYLGSVQMGGTG
jgi:branched-chain amino acid transport system ATP-binding protein